MIDLKKLAQVSKAVSEKLGLLFPENRYQDLTVGLMEASRELGLEGDGESLGSLLIRQQLSASQLNTLAEKLTIGETYFFREKQILSTFQEMIMPSLLKQREETTRSIRIWSAGCCSGEEPYTLAMILADMIPDISTWNITILATDINRKFLDKAIKGRYTPWSFRETPPEIKTRYFLPVGKEFEISREIRKMVTFHPLNLVEDPFPSETNHTDSMDVIFCRNVLMYFSPETIRTIGEKFFHTLSEGGWFITSQVELSDDLFSPFTKVNHRRAFLYQKLQKAVDVPVSPQVLSKRSGKIPLQNHHRSAKKMVPAPSKPVLRKRILTDETVIVKNEKMPGGDLLQTIREYANRGDLINALRSADELIAMEPSSPEAYYLKAMILIEKRDPGQAELQLKKSLYLDPDHLLAHFQMANLCLLTGKVSQAKKHKQNVKDLLQRFKAEDVVPGSDGMTAGSLEGLLQSINIP